jgi:hypothetical protein
MQSEDRTGKMPNPWSEEEEDYLHTTLEDMCP